MEANKYNNIIVSYGVKLLPQIITVEVQNI